MEFETEPGHVFHKNQAGEIDAELFFTEPQGTTLFKLNKVVVAPELAGKRIEPQMFDAMMAYLRSDFWTLVASLQHVPYHKDGREPEEGFDTGTLIQYVYNRSFGVNFPLVTHQQEAATIAIEAAQAKPMDLLFWGKRGEAFGAGIYLGGGKYIVADPQDGEVMIKPLHPQWLPDFAGTIR
ncbi:MAG: C40 family peptidase [Lactobacillaceae bacterium]|nr:C40 family peptidase [Lactobacillaceae bacterium]